MNMAGRAMRPVLDEAKAHFLSYAKNKDIRHLEAARSNIYASHLLITREQGQAFKAALDGAAEGKSDVADLYGWLRLNTAMRDCSIGDEWFLAGKGERGDGAWYKWQRPQDRLGPGIFRDVHVERMIFAGQCILNGSCQELYEYAYRDLFAAGPEILRPNLTPGILERALSGLLKNNLLPGLIRAYCLGISLHDYGRLLKDKVKSDPGDNGPLAKQHRFSGAILAGDLLQNLGFDAFQIEAVKLLIRQHDAVWNCYCLEKYGEERSNETTPQTVNADIEQTAAKLPGTGMLPPGTEAGPLRIMLWKMITAAGIADIYASGDRYLSDDFIYFLLSNHSRVG